MPTVVGVPPAAEEAGAAEEEGGDRPLPLGEHRTRMRQAERHLAGVTARGHHLEEERLLLGTLHQRLKIPTPPIHLAARLPAEQALPAVHGAVPLQADHRVGAERHPVGLHKADGEAPLPPGPEILGEARRRPGLVTRGVELHPQRTKTHGAVRHPDIPTPTGQALQLVETRTAGAPLGEMNGVDLPTALLHRIQLLHQVLALCRLQPPEHHYLRLHRVPFLLRRRPRLDLAMAVHPHLVCSA